MKVRTFLKLMLVILPGFALIEGYCLKCGTRRLGWALLNPQNQTCPKCGAGLQITQNGRTITSGYSPFQADKYVLKKSDKDIKSDGDGKDTDIKKRQR
jgi:transcription initiation factor IIE alpha subunit